MERGVLPVAHKATLSDYFMAIDKRLENLLEHQVSLLARIRDYTVRMIFPCMEYARYAVPDMFVIPDTGGRADATFIWWEDSMEAYALSEYERPGRDIFLSEDETGFVEIFGDTLRGGDYSRQRYYLLSSPHTPIKWQVAVHPFARAVSLWGQRRDMLMLHAAAVGWQGHGILFVGHGGTGKSTLAVSCLLDGFDFVSDDYCLMNETGAREVYPIYTNVSLNTDSLEKMPSFKPFEILPMQGEKRSFCISDGRIARALPVEAVVLPEVISSNKPCIERDLSTKALGQVVYSTVKQLGRWHDTEYIKKLSQRLLGLPIYRFSVTADLAADTGCLKKWMGEL